MRAEEPNIYENSSLKFVNHAEGYIEPDGAGGYEYVYQYKDHLGNIRLSYSDSNDDGIVDVNEIVEEANYYPFGLKHRGYNGQVNGTQNKFLTYNGVELEESLGLNLYEMDLRQFDPAIGRWTSIDPVTHHSQSTYNGYDNNPIFWADPSEADGHHYLFDNNIIQNFYEKLDNDDTFMKETPKLWSGWGWYNNDKKKKTKAKEGEQSKKDDDNSSEETEKKKFTFKKGKSPFEVKEYTWIGGGEFIEGDYGKLVIKQLLKKSSSDFKGQAIESSGFSVGGGLGSPLELFTATRGTIYFDKAASGNNLLELFQETKYIRIVAVSSVIKYTRIEAYTDRSMSEKLWHANMFGFGVITMGIQSHRYTVDFKNK